MPNLYEKNSHHRVGWILTWLTLTQFMIEVIGSFAGRVKDRPSSEEFEALIPMSAQAVAQHEEDNVTVAPNPINTPMIAVMVQTKIHREVNRGLCCSKTRKKRSALKKY